MQRFFFPSFRLWIPKTVQRSALCRSRRELSNASLVFTCKFWLRYIRERARQSVAKRGPAAFASATSASATRSSRPFFGRRAIHFLCFYVLNFSNALFQTRLKSNASALNASPPPNAGAFESAGKRHPDVSRERRFSEDLSLGINKIAINR